jgi:molybdopterin-biosynthesis enzyme MoeA-like protein
MLVAMDLARRQGGARKVGAIGPDSASASDRREGERARGNNRFRLSRSMSARPARGHSTARIAVCAAFPAGDMSLRFGLFVIGDEILSGKRADRHLARVIEMLSSRGLALGWALYLPDDRARLAEGFRRSIAGGDVVFSCGGIGSTPDDHTRQAVADALGLPLALHPEAAVLIAARCARLGQPDMTTPENRQRLTMGEFPAGSRIVPNPYNGIPGFAVARHYFVPGFPAMAWPMIEATLDSDFKEHFHAEPAAERSLLVFDTAESALVPMMQRIERDFAPVRTFSLPSLGDGRDGRPARRHIELGVKGPVGMIEAAFDALRRDVEAIGSEFSVG